MKVDKFLHCCLTVEKPDYFVGGVTQGETADGKDAKSGAGGSVDNGLVGRTKPQAFTEDYGKSGTGGKVDTSLWARASADRKL